MNSNNLKTLLTEYDQKRSDAILLARKKKYDIYDKYPELEQIDNAISSLSIKSIKTILTSKDKKLVDSINSELSNMRSKRIAFMKEHKISPKDLEPVFECSKCNDTGYIKTKEGNVLCNCIKQKLYNIEYNNSNIYDLKNQNFKNFRLDCYSDVVDKEKFLLEKI